MNRVHDQPLAEHVHFGHNVPRPLGLDPFQAFVALHLDPAGSMRKLDGERELVPVGGRQTQLIHLTALAPVVPASSAIWIVRSIARLSSSRGR